MKKAFLIFLLVFVTAFILYAYKLKSISRSRLDQATSKGYLTHAWQIVAVYAAHHDEIPPAVICSCNNSVSYCHSWRAAVLKNVNEIKVLAGAKYSFSEPWDSRSNLKAANIICNHGLNYFHTHKASNIHSASIQAVVGEGGVWRMFDSVPTGYVHKNPETLALAIIPNSTKSIFRPTDITLQELAVYVNVYGEVHVITAGGKFIVLDEEWVRNRVRID